eukprot:9489521-Pyramimonas_sp.AAC.1
MRAARCRSACWQMYGCQALLSANALCHLSSFGDVASAQDSALAYAQLAHHAAAHSGARPIGPSGEYTHASCV